MENVITKPKMKLLLKEMGNVLSQLESKLDLKFSVRSISYNNVDGKIGIEFVLKNGDNNGLSIAEVKAKKEWESWHMFYGFQNEWLYQEYDENSHRYKIMGINPKATRYPVLVKDVFSGQNYKVTKEHVISGMKNQ